VSPACGEGLVTHEGARPNFSLLEAYHMADVMDSARVLASNVTWFIVAILDCVMFCGL
jgi:hypothetical protein